jgi:uncharacterized membrane protein
MMRGGDILGGVEKSVEIKASPEKVWEMLAMDRCPEWMHGPKSAEYTSEARTSKDKYRVGASAHVIKEKQEELDFEITESLENEKLTIRISPIHGATLTASFVLRPMDVGTEMIYAIDYEMPWGIFGKFLDKLFVRRGLRKDISGEAEKLKSILEN